MRIFIDEMLKDVSKWLRLFGIKNIYLKNLKDTEIERIVVRNNGILITSDKELAKRMENSIYIDIRDSIEVKVIKAIKETNSSINFDNLICVKCGENLIRVDKKEVYGKIYEKVYNNQDLFFYCKKCKKYYWKGKHWNNIMKFYEKIKSKLNH